MAHVEVLTDPVALARHVAEWLTEAALASEESFRVALSGGSTPRRMYEVLASDDFLPRFPWQRVFWYWGDERFVPDEHPDSNYHMTRVALFDAAPVSPENIFPIPTDGEPEEAARRYEQTLQAAYGATVLDPARPLFDVTFLGLGADGHTASLLPNEPVLEVRDRWVAPVPHGRSEARITMTYPTLESSRRVAFLVAGAEKAGVVEAIFTGVNHLPAARLKPAGEVIWFLDQAAAAGLRA